MIHQARAVKPIRRDIEDRVMYTGRRAELLALKIPCKPKRFVPEYHFAREDPTPGVELKWILSFIPIIILELNDN